jgi:predicted Zn-dependent protease
VADGERLLKELSADSPTDVETLDILAMAQLKLGKPGEATEELNKALLQAPQDLRSTTLLVITKLAQRDFASAETVLRTFVKQNPSSSDARVLLGRVFFVEGKLPEAAEFLQEALAISPHLITASILLGETQLSLNQPAAAEKTFKRLATFGDSGSKHTYALFVPAGQTGGRSQRVGETCERGSI